MEGMPAWNMVDVAVLAVLAAGAIFGWRRGLSGELAGLLSAVAAFSAAWLLYADIGDELHAVTRLSERAAYTVAFVLLAVAGLAAMRILRFILRHLMEFSFRPLIERAGGALAGGLRYGVLAAACVFVFGLSAHPRLRGPFAENSLAGRRLQQWVPPAYAHWAERLPGAPEPPAVPAEPEEAD